LEDFEVHIRDVDIERSEADNLLQQEPWDEIWSEIKGGKYEVVVLSPPCDSFSRARCKSCFTPGPTPVRNAHHPWGFPWLTGSNRHPTGGAGCWITMFLKRDVSQQLTFAWKMAVMFCLSN
jgi:hypothetical protein